MSRRTLGVVLYTDRINWMQFPVKGSHGFAWIKTLSRDNETGAKTALIRFEPGFRAEAAVSEWPMDIYTLEGEMRCGDLSYNKDTYHYRPAGTEMGPVETASGITRLIFTADSKDPDRSSDKEVFVQNVLSDIPVSHGAETENGGTAAETFGGVSNSVQSMFDTGHIAPDPTAPVPPAPPSALKWRKILRLDPKAEMAVRAQRVAKAGIRDCVDEVHIHPWSEEAFMVIGENQDYCHDIEGHWHWTAGTYVCRPPHECLHGDALKLDDNYYMIVRSGWTDDPVKAAAWKAEQDATQVAVPAQTFVE
jgi:hypothetical protein